MFYQWHFQRSAIKREFGRIEHPFRLPGMKCTVCNDTWAQISAVPFRCPPALRTEFLKLSPRPIDQEAHRILRSRLIEASDQSFLDLRPGNGLMPALCIGIDPAAEIQALFPSALIVSIQFKKEVEEAGIKGFSFFELMLMDVAPETTFAERTRNVVVSFSDQVRCDENTNFWFMMPDHAESYLPHIVTIECESCGLSELGPCGPNDIDAVLARTDIAVFPDIKGAIVSERLKKFLEDRGVDGFQPLKG